MTYRKLRIIISGGGTGGHIFPAISIANKFKEVNPDNEILFVGAEGKWRWTRCRQQDIGSLVCLWPDCSANSPCTIF